MTKSLFAALLGGGAVILAPSAQAQDAATPSTTVPVGDPQAQIAELQAQVAELRKAIGELKQAMVQTTPSWKGAPQLEDKEAGWSFKPRGRLQFDAGVVGAPNGVDRPGTGFSNELRRGRLGVEGTMPGKIGYRAELEFAEGEPEFTDAFLSLQRGPALITIGQHNHFQSLEDLTSSLHTSFIERAAFTDAFGFERRVGASVQFARGALLAQAGLFTDNIADLDEANNSYSVDGRLVFAPKLGGNQLHFGASAHRRELNDAAASLRYRQRPAVHSTDLRFIDTGILGGAETETGLGLEAAGIFGSLHVAGESFWQKVGRAGPADPTFFGGYVEAGYFFTGEQRGYKPGTFDRVKVLKPLAKGGIGAISLNVRYDHLNLNDAGVRGGKQNGYQASLNWKPMDHLLFGLNYARLNYEDAAIPADGDRDYGVDVGAVRAQVDF